MERSGNGATFRTNTRGETSSLRLSVADVEPGAAIVLELEEAAETGSAPPFYRPRAVIPGGRVRLPLSDLRGGRLEKLLPIENYHRDSVTLRRIRLDGPRDLTFTYTDTDTPRQGDYYYVRVRQLNDAMAWSSPVYGRRASVAVGGGFKRGVRLRKSGQSPTPRFSTRGKSRPSPYRLRSADRPLLTSSNLSLFGQHVLGFIAIGDSLISSVSQ